MYVSESGPIDLDRFAILRCGSVLASLRAVNSAVTRDRRHMTPHLTALLIGLGIGGIYALVATGYNLVFSSSGVFNLAQGDLVTLGGVLTATVPVTVHWAALLPFLPVVG